MNTLKDLLELSSISILKLNKCIIVWVLSNYFSTCSEGSQNKNKNWVSKKWYNKIGKADYKTFL